MTTNDGHGGSHGAPEPGAEIASAVPALIADPNLVVVDGRYLLYGTTDGIPGWGASSFQAFESTDLVEWTTLGEVLVLGRDVSWASAHAWAPAMVARNGRCYLYFTAESSIGVAVADHPAGPFVDIGRPLVRAGDFPGVAIDPSVFIDHDGTPYLCWGNDRLHIVPLDASMTAFRAEDVVTWTPPGFREAGWIHRRGDTYYLSWSENDTREPEYRVRYATGPSPVGPWEVQGVLVEMRPERGILGTGHHSIAQVPGTDTWLIAYHRFAIPGGNGYTRETMVDLLTHLPDGRLAPVEPAREHLRVPASGAAAGRARPAQA